MWILVVGCRMFGSERLGGGEDSMIARKGIYLIFMRIFILTSLVALMGKWISRGKWSVFSYSYTKRSNS